MKYTNKSRLPKSLKDAIEKNTYDLSQSNPNMYSITTILNPPKIKHLSLRHWGALTRDVSDSIWLLLGSSVHSVMERISDKERFIEERMYIDTNTWDLVDKQNLKSDVVYLAGKPDLYDHTEEMVEDYKVTSVYKVLANNYKEWEEQLNCYAWLYKKLGFPVKSIRIVAILKDWSRAKAKRERNYPRTAAIPIKINLWSEEKQLNFMKERLALHLKYRQTPDDEIPPCSAEERWAKPDKWALKKEGRKTAVKLFDSEKEAQDIAIKSNLSTSNMAKSESKRDFYFVEHRPAEDTRCLYFCDVCKFCNFYQNKYNKK